MEKEILFSELNRGMLEERGDVFARNLARNLPLIERFGGIGRAVPLLQGKDVIIAGAGPSLDRAIPLLKKYRHRQELAVIAVDMALRSLLAGGVKPAFVITCETTPAGFFSGLSTAGMHLLAFSCASPYNLGMWAGDISFYNWMAGGPPYDELWERAGKLGSVATGGLVSTQAVALALGSSVRSLMLAGNDLGFGHTYYAADAAYHRFRSVINRFRGLATLDYRSVASSREVEISRGDRLFHSNRQFLAGKLWLEELFAGNSMEVFDCSEPGCSERHVTKMPLKRYFERFEKQRHKRR